MSASTAGPKLRSILAGIALFCAILGFFAVLPEAIKWAGYPLLWLPARLGLVNQVTVAAVQSFDLATPPNQMVASTVGRYAVYTRDSDLLALELVATRPWLNVSALVTGERAPAYLVPRGLRPYDTPLALGRPVLTFVVDTPGVYEFSRVMLSPPELVSVVPDYVTGKEKVINFLMLSQLALVSALPFRWAMHRGMSRRRALRTERRSRRARADELWQRLRNRVR